MKLITYIWNYGRLIYDIYSLYSLYERRGDIDSEEALGLLDEINTRINDSGTICIKFTQWLIPILEAMYIHSDVSKPYWLTKLETLYEKCPIHSHQYTVSLYEKTFHKPLSDDYELLDVIGSGSIAQVYQLIDKNSGEYLAMKVVHPEIREQLLLFRFILKVILFIPTFHQIIYNIIPIDLIRFLDQFEDQQDMIKESNNLLRMNYNYTHNKYVVIPQLVQCEKDILIMTYEGAEAMDDMDISDYEKMKIVNLLHLFMKTNQLFYNFNHGDVHKGNWKVRKINGRYGLVIYDLGFCWKLHNKDRDINFKLTEAFNSSDEADDHRVFDDNIEQFVNIFAFILNNDSISSKEHIRAYIEDNYSKLGKCYECDPINIFRDVTTISKELSITIEPLYAQCIITLIQTYKYFTIYNINNEKGSSNPKYKLMRGKYLDMITLCNTYEIFAEFKQYLTDFMMDQDIMVSELFDTLDESVIPSEVKGLLDFN